VKRLVVLAVSHALALALGFALGVYVLPILTAPPAPSAEQMAAVRAEAVYEGRFRRDLQDSDLLHWGEGTVYVGPTAVSLSGRVAPGPDYKLYLSPEFVETEAAFERLRPEMVRVGDVNTFDNFVVAVPERVDPARFNTVIVWCEAFGQFITAARYQ
jgi:hypothetical protein